MIHCLDLHFLNRTEAIGSYLIESSQGPILVESGPHSTIGQLKIGLQKYGYRLKDIKHVFLTHIHLDHAGAAWVFAEHGAKIYVHPFGANHLENPEKLMESAKMIYQDKMDMLWGKMKNIPRNQIIECENSEEVTLGEHTFIAWHTPGHAKHHIAWQLEKSLFSGDVAGVKIKNGPVVPPCPPPDINLEEWASSIQTIMNLELDKLYLTHFGEITNIDDHLGKLETILQDWSQWIKKEWKSGKSSEEITPLFSEYTKTQLLELGLTEEHTLKYEAANPSWMSVAGLIRYWKKKEL